MDAPAGGLSRRAVLVLRAALLLFVLAWIFGPYALRAEVPVWLPFLVALGLELNFFVGARRARRAARRPDRAPQEADRDLFDDAGQELLLVRRDGEELWIPYADETGEELEALITEARAERERAHHERPRSLPLARPQRRWPVRQLFAGISVVAALAAVVWFVDSRSGWNGVGADDRTAATARFSTEAARIAGRRVAIRCDDSGQYVGAVQHADGVAVVGGSVAYLTPDRCFDLYRLAFRDEVTESQTGRSIAVLAHESWHLRGVRDEATTECYAVQSGVELGRRLGLSVSRARQLMRQQLAENALQRSDYVVTAGCRDGGSLDLRPRDVRFP